LDKEPLHRYGTYSHVDFDLFISSSSFWLFDSILPLLSLYIYFILKYEWNSFF
jgi:hypothetical protein